MKVLAAGLVPVLFLMACGGEGSSQSPVSTSACSGVATTIAYARLVRDADTLHGQIFDFTGEVFQYDTKTGRDHLLLSVTKSESGNYYSDNVLVDLPSSIDTENVFNESLLHVTAAVVGTYTYKNALNADLTVPEVQACSLEVLPSPSPS